MPDDLERRLAAPPQGEEFLAEWRKRKAAWAKARRNRRGKRPVPQITGVRIPPEQDRAFREMVALTEELGLYEEQP
jgi:hypothetical protein